MFLSHSSCVTAWTTSIHWCELGVRRIVWIVMSCQELLKIVTPMWWLYCCASKVPTRLTIADADEYYEIGHYTHEDIYIYMMKIENAFLCWVPLWVKKSPLNIKRACWRWDPLWVDNDPHFLRNEHSFTLLFVSVCLSQKMSFFSLCVCLFFFRRTSTFSLWESRK